MDLSLLSLIPQTFVNDFIAAMQHAYTEYTEGGGRASCKSSTVSIIIAVLMDTHPDFNAFICRKVAGTLRDSVYEQIKWALEMLHISEKYIETVSPLKIVNKYTGQQYIFRGGDHAEKIKSIKLKRGYFAITWFEEITEFTPSDIQSIKISTMRGGEKFWLFYTYNPPESARNWCNEEFKKNKPGRLVHFSDYRTTPREWLGEAFFQEAEYLRQTNERAYRNVYLGEATGSGRLVFENIRVEEISDDFINSRDFIECGLDWGYYPDPLAFNVSSYDPATRTLYIYGELELSKSGNDESFISIGDYMQKLGLDIAQDEITADSAEPKSIADFKRWGANIRGANKGRLGHDKNKGKTSREASFKWLQTLRKIIIDPHRAPKTLDEFSLYEHDIDKKTGEVLAGYPDGQPDHHIDAIRYANERYWRHAGE